MPQYGHRIAISVILLGSLAQIMLCSYSLALRSTFAPCVPNAAAAPGDEVTLCIPASARFNGILCEGDIGVFGVVIGLCVLSETRGQRARRATRLAWLAGAFLASTLGTIYLFTQVI
jgi:hypothetical protein